MCLAKHSLDRQTHTQSMSASQGPCYGYMEESSKYFLLRYFLICDLGESVLKTR